LLAAGFLLTGARGSSARDAPIPGALPIRLNRQPVGVRAESSPVKWRGGEYRLVRIGQAEFQEDAHGHLTGRLTAEVTSFDNVQYEVHAAVYDPAGKLLGTAKAPCSVERVWLGKTLQSSQELPLDFGVSRAYDRARWLTLAISEHPVLTPDQWQK
jgi:hypothetical protein